MPIDVVHFNPVRRRPGVLGRFLPRRPLNNFGDLLGPLLVAAIVKSQGLRDTTVGGTRLVTVGSIMKLTQPGDVVWGTGVNGKSMDTGAAPALDVRSVRGPRTRDLLVARGTEVPEIFGDPALLWSTFWPRREYLSSAPSRHELSPVGVVPNFHDRVRTRDRRLIDPLSPPHEVIGRIARSAFICGSSLHGIVIAESFGIPARLIRPGAEHSFKYDDYYAGTGRESYQPANSVSEAIEMGGEPPADYDAAALLAAFPLDLWAS
ncbi:polysaccharide pyruvyl transferase family protein [Microbacterium sp. P05]|uniref:polysaccharide pyruvyl transferase family protein n=1 Tax=Microbacterium sp. P05 TaxID=3366948 RepID=UPI003745C242